MSIRSRSLAFGFVVSGMAGAHAQTAPSANDAARADSLYRAGDFVAAAVAYDALTRTVPGVAQYWGRLGASLHRTRRYPEAAAAFEHGLTIARTPLLMYNLASAHARMGHADLAFRWLDSAVANGFAQEQTLAGDSDFVVLHRDPRYATLIADVRRARQPCVDRAESHQFDFWVGDWEVTNAQGQHAGSSAVQKILSDCVVFENWTDGQDGHGKSLNAYNAGLHMWQQFWTDQYGGVTEYRESKWVNGSLQYLARVPAPQGDVLQRMTFTSVDANTVRQLGERSVDDGKTFTVAYDLYYHRRK